MTLFLRFEASGSRRHLRFGFGFYTPKKKSENVPGSWSGLACQAELALLACAISRNFVFGVQNSESPNFKCNFEGFRRPLAKEGEHFLTQH